MKGKYYIDIKLPCLRVYTGEIFTGEVQSTQTTPLGRFFFFLGGGGGWSVLGNNKANRQMNVTVVTSWLRTITNINMVEIGRPPSSDLRPVF